MLPWRPLRSIVPVPEGFDIGSRDSWWRGRHQKSLVQRLRTALEECGSARRPGTPLAPAAWRHKRRRLPGEPDPRTAGAALESAAAAIDRERHPPGRHGSAKVALTGD